jgi:hypothetical protein
MRLELALVNPTLGVCCHYKLESVCVACMHYSVVMKVV